MEAVRLRAMCGRGLQGMMCGSRLLWAATSRGLKQRIRLVAVPASCSRCLSEQHGRSMVSSDTGIALIT